MVNCMKIWLAANGDMIKVGELVYLYHLKESKEYGYYELVPWARRARIVKGDRKSTRLNSSHLPTSRMPSSA